MKLSHRNKSKTRRPLSRFMGFSCPRGQKRGRNISRGVCFYDADENPQRGWKSVLFAGRYTLSEPQLNKESNKLSHRTKIVNQETPFPFYGVFLSTGTERGLKISRGVCFYDADEIRRGVVEIKDSIEVRSFAGTYNLCEVLLDKESNEVVAPHPIVNQETPFPILWGFPAHGDRKGS
ncbi:hypothetical protein CEXT_687101 [Caerostris extrusa]|uniref:Uncharacterized protein n=1 Tax=Caerostris extrusa TaxID=172846 RepID=A0AAV4NEE9_CAEEX|nr:hypothetical protein CEXT_687101 [Caerostris extrusa]